MPFVRSSLHMICKLIVLAVATMARPISTHSWRFVFKFMNIPFVSIFFLVSSFINCLLFFSTSIIFCNFFWDLCWLLSLLQLPFTHFRSRSPHLETLLWFFFSFLGISQYLRTIDAFSVSCSDGRDIFSVS